MCPHYLRTACKSLLSLFSRTHHLAAASGFQPRDVPWIQPALVLFSLTFAPPLKVGPWKFRRIFAFLALVTMTRLRPPDRLHYLRLCVFMDNVLALLIVTPSISQCYPYSIVIPIDVDDAVLVHFWNPHTYSTSFCHRSLLFRLFWAPRLPFAVERYRILDSLPLFNHILFYPWCLTIFFPSRLPFATIRLIRIETTYRPWSILFYP